MFRAPPNCVAREIDIFLGFTWRDWSTTLIPCSLFSIGAMRTLPWTFDTFQSYLFLIFWLTAWIYFFTLSNQITGVEEDRINKPDRPLVTGKVTMAGAKKRWVLALTAFLSIAVYEPTLLPETVIWILDTAVLVATPFGDHWFNKNCIRDGSERSVLAVSLWTGLLINVQDLRDVKGDVAIGRKTLPIAIGVPESRRIITFLLIPVSLMTLYMGGILSLAPFPLVAVHVFLGYRILLEKGALYDHKTYMIWTYIFCLILAFTALEGIKWSTIVSPAWTVDRS
ncbi:hypothetical protein BT96DRAFT_1013349 [Gymnopus androsaceus JB14]|uniref:UbiA prenyltransferase n=1 Tax=Gymnopus androsaceus JB14 TaxID=1447944 RepID=A0A6A4IDU0_9AGAR|nr:hypothetical protein BT96DRAFT_1013349 [Gymnopus androsaceus JB14]